MMSMKAGFALNLCIFSNNRDNGLNKAELLKADEATVRIKFDLLLLVLLLLLLARKF